MDDRAFAKCASRTDRDARMGILDTTITYYLDLSRVEEDDDFQVLCEREDGRWESMDPMAPRVVAAREAARLSAPSIPRNDIPPTITHDDVAPRRSPLAQR